MPPIRTIPPAKVVKTERTHEENQERAYIAASRRSDRSLEARVESARRASEIHKRRTGRSLRVTEQDVINEEMYEEEDDDLPMQYRRLTAHLQTGSVDFNRRLAAYLTNQVAMRSAMEQMMRNQSYPNAPQFANNTMFPSPISNPSLTASPTSSYRPAPYPNPHRPNFQQNHGRAYSTAAASMNEHQQHNQPNTPSIPNNSLDQRRMSTPGGLPTPSPHNVNTSGVPDPDYQRQTQSATMPNYPPSWQDMGPFTTTLPPEAQQMLGPGLDPNDAFSQTLMYGSNMYTNSPYYSWGGSSMQQNYDKNEMFMNPYTGMSATLAPSALDNAAGEASMSSTPKEKSSRTSSSSATTAEALTAPSTGFDFSNSQDSKLAGFPMGTGMTRENSRQDEEDQNPQVNGREGVKCEASDGFWENFTHQESGEWGAEDGETAVV